MGTMTGSGGGGVLRDHHEWTVAADPAQRLIYALGAIGGIGVYLIAQRLGCAARGVAVAPAWRPWFGA